MDGDIKKSSSKMSQREYEALLEYKPIGTQKPDIIDERGSLDTLDDVVKRAKHYRDERLLNRLPYPWEEEERPYIVTKSTQNPQPYVKKTYYVNGYYSSDPSTETIIETVEPSAASIISPQLNIRGKYGTFKSSKKSKNAPIIFILGGLTWPNTKATDAQIGNGKNDSRYPGDKKDGVEGYMWLYGFKDLHDFNIYNCFTHKDGSGGWDECSSILTNNSIVPEKKILIAFSAGVNMIHEGLLNKAPANTWNIIHLIGGTDGAMKRSKSILNTPNVQIYYIQSKGIDTASEGASVATKKEIASKLPSDRVLNSSGHPNGVTVSANWIDKNVQVTLPPSQPIVRKRVVTRNKNIIRVIAKLKGGRTTFVNAADAGSYTLGNLSPLAAAPPANPQQKSREIAELKADPGYGFWKNQIIKNGGDRWLSAVYDECVQIRCVFWNLMFVMAFESGLYPGAKNPRSSAAGLIQWMSYGLFRKHGFASPRDANAFQQLPFITKYYQGRGGWKKKGVPNLIAAYTYIAGGNTSDPNKVIYTKSKNPRVLTLNPLWDLDKDGRVTAGEMTLSVIRKWYRVKDNSWINKYPNGIWRKDPTIFQIKGLRR